MIDRKTTFSPCRKHRYSLWREWWQSDCLVCDGTLPVGEVCNTCNATHGSDYVMFIGLNPSTADERNDDPTIRRCIGYAKAWGYNALCMTNLFSFRATDPRDMKSAPMPTTEENDRWLWDLASRAAIVVAAWGTHGRCGERDVRVRQMMMHAEVTLRCLGTNRGGTPKHPLYLSKGAQLIGFN